MKLLLRAFFTFSAAFVVSFATLAQTKIIIGHKPASPYKELVNHQSVVNFDFIIENQSKDTISLDKLEVAFLDKDNNVLLEKFLDNNGTAPSIATIPNIQWDGTSKTSLFNPFTELKSNSIHKLKYTFTFVDTQENEFTVVHTVTPRGYTQPGSYIVPVKNKLLVYDGHDFYSHHRRFDTEFKFIKEFGFDGNFMRYSYDLVVLDKQGKKHKGTGEANTDWFGFGAEVRAVANGTVVAVVTSLLDDKKFKMEELKVTPFALFGNYVIIQHQDSLFSVYGHLKQNSSTNLKVGDKVKQGQKIGEIGTSGSSFFPHLHFEMQNALTHQAEGVPSYFSNFFFLDGTKPKPVTHGTINTGDIIQAN